MSPTRAPPGIIPALLSGEIDFTIAAVNSLLPHFKSGKLRPIAMAGSSSHRDPARRSDDRRSGTRCPATPWTSGSEVMAPAGTPRSIIERLNGEIKTASSATRRSSGKD